MENEKELLEKVFKTQVIIFEKLIDIENKVKGQTGFGGGYDFALEEINRELSKKRT
jgi:hypothetical protein